MSEQDKLDVNNRARERWMDIFRGFAIILVIFHHVLSILEVDYKIDRPVPLIEITQAFGLMRMPALMFLSGLLLPSSMTKGLASYFEGKVKRIVWPLLVWTTITYAIMQDQPLFGLGSLIRLYVGGYHHLWYLIFILLFYVLAPFIQRFGFLPIALIALFISVVSPDGGKYTERLFFLMFFFFLGAFAGLKRGYLNTIIHSKAAYAIVPLAAGVMWASAHYNIQYGPLYSPLSLILVGAVCVISKIVDRLPIAAMLSYIGRYSLIFYVSHYAALFVAIGLAKQIGMSDRNAISAFAIVGAVSCGIALVELSRAVPVANLLFELPKRKRHAAT